MKTWVLIIVLMVGILFTGCTEEGQESESGDKSGAQNSNEYQKTSFDMAQVREELQTLGNKERKDAEEEDKGPHFSYPDAVRGIYVTGNTAGLSRFDDLIEMVNQSDLNSMVIDIKNDHGYITYKLEGTEYDDMSQNYIKDPEAMLETLSEHEIYPIARIVVFKDTVLAEKHPEYAFRRPDGSVWKNRKGEAFVNPFMEEVWEYNIEIAEKAAELGFQEIQFDYVRFPEGFGGMDTSLEYAWGSYSEEKLTPRLEEEWEAIIAEQDAEDSPDLTEEVIGEEDVDLDALEKENNENKAEENGNNEDNGDQDKQAETGKTLEDLEPPEYDYGLARVMAVTDFVEKAYARLQPYDVDVSVDIFGYTVTVPESRGIGQNFFKICQHVDIISSMIYPSHWGRGNFGYTNPDKHPYEIVDEYSQLENEILDKMEDPPQSRPWLQDFTATWLGSGNYINYGVAEIEAQIRALKENGIEEYLLWNAANQYTQGVDYTPWEED